MGAIGSHSVDKTNDEKAAPVQLLRSAPRYKRISKTNTIATPESASLTVALPELDRTTTGRRSACDASPPPQEIGRDDDVSPPLDPEMAGSHFPGRVLKPIIRTALLHFRAVFVARPCSQTATAHVAGCFRPSACFAFHAQGLRSLSLLMTPLAAN